MTAWKKKRAAEAARPSSIKGSFLELVAHSERVATSDPVVQLVVPLSRSGASIGGRRLRRSAVEHVVDFAVDAQVARDRNLPGEVQVQVENPADLVVIDGLHTRDRHVALPQRVIEDAVRDVAPLRE